MTQDVLVSKNGRQCVDFGRFHDTLPINDCPAPVKTMGKLRTGHIAVRPGLAPCRFRARSPAARLPGGSGIRMRS